MKKFTTILLLLAIAISTAMAQAPQQFKYQAALRDSDGAIMANEAVTVEIAILQGSTSGSSVFSESHDVTTTAQGIINLNIGSQADLSTVDWSADTYFIQITVDGTVMGVSQLLSVPYAQYANEAGNTFGGSYMDLTNKPIFPDSISEYGFSGNYSDLTDVPDLADTVIYLQELSLTDNQLTISDGNSVTLPGSNNLVPVYTTTEIFALTPEQGQAVFNSDEELYQVYDGTKWVSFNSDCWPQPTYADAGANQEFNDVTVSATLAANTPEAGHGTGQWSIESGTGGSFADATNPATTFTGTECTAYTLQWTISTSCNSSSDNVNIEFNQTPTVADAGSDQTFNDGTVSATLAANTPEAGHETGQWSIESGTGGSFVDATNPTTSFTGVLREGYILKWTISTPCAISEDEVVIEFYDDGAGDPVTDNDGNTYQTVWIGTQNWMAENLKTTTYNNGTSIDLVTDNTAWENSTTGAYCWYDNDQATYADTYGALYNWHAVNTGNLCPDGWHVPTDEEWKTLEMHLGMSQADADDTNWRGTNEGSKLAGNAGLWNDGDLETDSEFGSSGFSALPGGLRSYNGSFYDEGNLGYWWSSTENSSSSAWVRDLYYSTSAVYRDYYYKEYGFSVRCLRDN